MFCTGDAIESLPCYVGGMTKTLDKPSSKRTKGYVLGRRGFAKISAVEGIRLSPEMEARFREFDREGLSPSERRKALARTFGKVR
jgi:hypothetical protein